MQEIMEFQLEHHVNSSQLDKINEELKAVKAMVKESTSAMQKVEKNIASLSEKLSKINQDIGNLKTEVKKAAVPKK
jgi:septal ring factor EnvC (AmiA/AmiB activator)